MNTTRVRKGSFPCLLFIFLLATIAGCATTSVSEKESEEKTTGDAFYARYEEAFQPSLYDPPIAAIEAIAEKGAPNTSKTPESLSAAIETVPGFRIQLLATTEIDEANALRAELGTIPQVDSVYVSYDSPYYKVRVGNFRLRPDANQLLKILTSRGYKDAWIVADRVLKRPPAKRSVPSTQDSK